MNYAPDGQATFWAVWEPANPTEDDMALMDDMLRAVRDASDTLRLPAISAKLDEALAVLGVARRAGSVPPPEPEIPAAVVEMIREVRPRQPVAGTLTPLQEAEVIARKQAGEKTAALAVEMGVSRAKIAEVWLNHWEKGAQRQTSK